MVDGGAHPRWKYGNGQYNEIMILIIIIIASIRPRDFAARTPQMSNTLPFIRITCARATSTSIRIYAPLTAASNRRPLNTLTMLTNLGILIREREHVVQLVPPFAKLKHFRSSRRRRRRRRSQMQSLSLSIFTIRWKFV